MKAPDDNFLSSGARRVHLFKRDYFLLLVAFFLVAFRFVVRFALFFFFVAISSSPKKSSVAETFAAYFLKRHRQCRTTS